MLQRSYRKTHVLAMLDTFFKKLMFSSSSPFPPNQWVRGAQRCLGTQKEISRHRKNFWPVCSRSKVVFDVVSSWFFPFGFKPRRRCSLPVRYALPIGLSGTSVEFFLRPPKPPCVRFQNIRTEWAELDIDESLQSKKQRFAGQPRRFAMLPITDRAEHVFFTKKMVFK